MKSFIVRNKKSLRGLNGGFLWCPVAESNHGHKDFQSFALPTELTGHIKSESCSSKKEISKLMFERNFVNEYSIKDLINEVSQVFMAVKLVCTELSLPWFQVNALAFIPDIEKTPIRPQWSLFTHGYTSHKGDCLNWATRLSEAGVPSLIFDQPGHYLGSFNEINSLEDFKNHAHELFGEAFLRLQSLIEQHTGFSHFQSIESIIVGGHSLGAFTAMKALKLPQFENLNRLGIGIGIGIGQRQATHLFETAFYEKTLAIRRQLVSPYLDSKEIFSWLKEAKENFEISNERVHLITGEDDIVVGAKGLEAFIEVLEKHNNKVTWEKPSRLPHHEPALATAHIFSFLKNHFQWKA